MIIFYSFIETLSAMAISLGVGSSTFALIFYFMGKHSPVLREAGRPYQKAVYIVLRIAMVLILLTEITKIVLFLQAGMQVQELFAASALMFMWTVVAVLFINAALMTFHLMPMKFGPAIQAASWYTLGILTALPIITFGYLSLALAYIGGILALAVIIELISQRVGLKGEVIAVEEVTVAVEPASDVQ